MRRSGFTLTEILVVVAIVTIIAAISFSVLGSAKNQAKKSVCIGNLHQIGTAAAMYQSDNDGFLPATNPRTDAVFTAKGISFLPDPLGPYGASMDIYHCPSSTMRARRGYEQLTDYLFRFVLNIDSRAGASAGDYIVAPQGSSVIAWDWNHTDGSDYIGGKGSWLVLKADTSVGKVKANALRKSFLVGGNWTFAAPSNPNAYGEMVFPGEDWPPTLRRVP